MLWSYLLLGLLFGGLNARSVARTSMTPDQAQRSMSGFCAGAAAFLVWAAFFVSFDVVGIGFVGFVMEVYVPALIVLWNRAKVAMPPNGRIADQVPRG